MKGIIPLGILNILLHSLIIAFTVVVLDPLSAHTTQKWHHWEAHLENLLAQMMS